MSDAVAPPSPARALVPEPDPGLNDAPSDPRPGPDDWIALLHKAAADAPGIGVIYELLALVAQRFGLEDAVLAVPNETLGTQIFRLSRQAIGQAELARILDGAGFVSTPDVVPLGAQRLVTGIAEVALATHLAQ